MSNNPELVFVRTSQAGDISVIETHQSLAAVESVNYRGFVSHPHSNGETVSFVAGVGHTVFGSLTVVCVAPRRWSISHVFVEKEAREIGIGDALVQMALNFLRTQNATWVESQAQPGNRDLKNLFERHGLVAQTITVGKSLSDLSTEVRASQ